MPIDLLRALGPFAERAAARARLPEARFAARHDPTARARLAAQEEAWQQADQEEATGLLEAWPTPAEALAQLADGAGPGWEDHPLDAFLEALVGEPPAAEAFPEPELVHLEPTPAAVALALAQALAEGPPELLTDLGCGTGHLLAALALLGEGPLHGVERDPAYLARARRLIQRLPTHGGAITLELGDARRHLPQPGQWLYLFTPFTGAALRAVLSAAAEKRCKLATYGPVSAEVSQDPRFRPLNPPDVFRLVRWETRPGARLP